MDSSSAGICPFLLHCVHEVAFDTAENDDGEGEGDKHEESAVEETTPVEGAATQATVFESFEDGSEGVELEDGFIFLWGCAQRVDDRCGIHKELDAKSDKELQVTVLGGQGWDDKPPRKGVERNQKDKEREEEKAPVQMKVGACEIEIEVHQDEQP